MLSLALLIHKLYVPFVINPKLHIKRDHDKQGQFKYSNPTIIFKVYKNW